jgi:hypothetical protein
MAFSKELTGSWDRRDKSARVSHSAALWALWLGWEYRLASH